MAQACSVVKDYRVPTNLELVGKTALILRARVVGEVKGDGMWDSKLVVEPIAALKGTMPSGRVEIAGAVLVPQPDKRGFGVLSNPYELESAHPLSYIGGCIRYMFPRGTTALFFLDQRDGQWIPAGGPFSRWGEDVLSDDAPWMQMVRFYAKVLAAPQDQRKPMLEAERDRLRSQADDPVAALMANDIDRQLAGPNEAWNTMMRKAIEGDGDIPAGAEPEAAAEAIASQLDDATGNTSEEMEPDNCSVSDDGKSVTCSAAVSVKPDPTQESQTRPKS
ncbi:hypothetical protein GRI58_14885 [Porphyrobacter algicida]|uniref:Uncharacterized protein n=1 Tax=Qipengyuania algicida TaxID=1836209 RepID=A0A845AHH9_9SPHN|nr:hypothetical protein [Qipengyuania algicida]MXP30092.1 hypothetical protein [Qipengyuania algicida]